MKIVLTGVSATPYAREYISNAAATLRQRLADRNISTRYYTPEGHRGLFALPPFMAEALEGEKPVELVS